jgi:hypothetical protein
MRPSKRARTVLTFSAVLAATIAVVFPATSRAAETDRVKAIAPLLVKQAWPMVELLLSELDAATEKVGRADVKQIGPFTRDDPFVAFPFVGRYTADKGVSSKVVPGNYVKVAIETDCRVRVEMLLKDLQVRKSASSPNTIEIVLPEFKLVADIPEEPNEVFSATWGGTKKKDKKLEAELRNDLINQVKGMAMSDFRKEFDSRRRAEVASELKQLLEAKAPKTKFVIK